MTDTFSTVNDEARAAFLADGVVCLRGLFGREWLEAIGNAIDADRSSPRRFFRDQTPEDSPAAYQFAYWTWPENPMMRQVVFDSPAADIAKDLLDAARVTLLMDNWFLREAGALNGAPWHHDEPYFDFDGGRKCAIWIPLEDASAEEGLSFIAGSHRDYGLFEPKNFKLDEPFEGVGADYSPIPDFNSDTFDDRRLSWDLKAGDCLVFDLRTAHGSTSGRKPLDRTIRRLSLRFGDQNVRFRPRGPWTRETSEFLISEGQEADAPLNCPMLPTVRPRPPAAGRNARP